MCDLPLYTPSRWIRNQIAPTLGNRQVNVKFVEPELSSERFWLYRPEFYDIIIVNFRR